MARERTLVSPRTSTHTRQSEDLCRCAHTSEDRLKAKVCVETPYIRGHLYTQVSVRTWTHTPQSEDFHRCAHTSVPYERGPTDKRGHTHVSTANRGHEFACINVNVNTCPPMDTALFMAHLVICFWITVIDNYSMQKHIAVKINSRKVVVLCFVFVLFGNWYRGRSSKRWTIYNALSRKYDAISLHFKISNTSGILVAIDAWTKHRRIWEGAIGAMPPKMPSHHCNQLANVITIH